MSPVNSDKAPKPKIFLPKYRVIDNQTGKEMRGIFVLEPGTDPAARIALEFYAEHIEEEPKREYVEAILKETARR